MYQKGVSTLTNAELLQVVIGSGNAGMPVTKIARKADKLLRSMGVGIQLSDLMAIQGLGSVKASQIIASLELAGRLTCQQNDQGYKDIDILADLYSDIRNSKKTMLLYAFFDGNGRLIDDHSEVINPKANTARIARRVFGLALSQSTASILVAVGGEEQFLEASMFELSLARDIFSTARLLSISVRSFVLVAPSGEYVVKEASRGKDS